MWLDARGSMFGEDHLNSWKILELPFRRTLLDESSVPGSECVNERFIDAVGGQRGTQKASLDLQEVNLYKPALEPESRDRF